MAKNLDISILLDFYGEMLTDKQRDLIDLYYNEDLSLGEIAQLQKITRQGVRDSVKRGEIFLYELEEKLGLFKRYKETQAVFEEIAQLSAEIEQISEGYQSQKLRTNAKRLRQIAAQQLENN